MFKDTALETKGKQMVNCDTHMVDQPERAVRAGERCLKASQAPCLPRSKTIFIFSQPSKQNTLLRGLPSINCCQGAKYSRWINDLMLLSSSYEEKKLPAVSLAIRHQY